MNCDVNITGNNVVVVVVVVVLVLVVVVVVIVVAIAAAAVVVVVVVIVILNLSSTIIRLQCSAEQISTRDWRDLPQHFMNAVSSTH
jgi:uncharacterized membrane protein